MLKIKFKYRDEMSKGEWRDQECYVSSVQECKDIYGLDTDPTIYEYKIISAEEI